MLITIRTTGGTPGTDAVLGPIDAARMEAELRHRLSAQLEALADLTSSHEPSAAEGIRYEVEVRGPGAAANVLLVEDTGDPEHPTARALAALMGTLGLAPPQPSPVG